MYVENTSNIDMDVHHIYMVTFKKPFKMFLHYSKLIHMHAEKNSWVIQIQNIAIGAIGDFLLSHSQFTTIMYALFQSSIFNYLHMLDDLMGTI